MHGSQVFVLLVAKYKFILYLKKQKKVPKTISLLGYSDIRNGGAR